MENEKAERSRARNDESSLSVISVRYRRDVEKDEKIKKQWEKSEICVGDRVRGLS